MITRLATAHRQLRVFLVGLMLVLASTFLAGGPAAADVMRPNMSAGGGGGGAGAAVIDDVEITNYGPRTPI